MFILGNGLVYIIYYAPYRAHFDLKPVDDPMLSSHFITV